MQSTQTKTLPLNQNSLVQRLQSTGDPAVTSIDWLDSDALKRLGFCGDAGLNSLEDIL